MPYGAENVDDAKNDDAQQELFPRLGSRFTRIRRYPTSLTNIPGLSSVGQPFVFST
jgi:hypothetical protein